MSAAEFEKIASDWIKTARHPKFGRPYTDLVYQPMLELLTYLRANGFKTFIVSGGGIEFMRPWTERIYGIPPEQIVGSSISSANSDTNRYLARIEPAPFPPITSTSLCPAALRGSSPQR